MSIAKITLTSKNVPIRIEEGEEVEPIVVYLNAVPIPQAPKVLPSTLISRDPLNMLTIGTDKKLFVTSTMIKSEW